MSTNQIMNSSLVSEKRPSQWEILMRKFSEAHKEHCKAISVDIPRVARSLKIFPTGSQYEGTWDILGMSGYGKFGFPNGVIYEGEFNDGMFHGAGDLLYPSGAILRGKWHKGKLLERRLFFADGLEYSEIDWKYCRMPDRRFTIEYDKGIQPAGRSYLTADQPTRIVPPGFFDTGDGFFDPSTKAVYKPDDLTALLRSPSVREQKWIVNNCRTAPQKQVGPRPDLYEEWLAPQDSPDAPQASAVDMRAPVERCILRDKDESKVLSTFWKHDEDLDSFGHEEHHSLYFLGPSLKSMLQKSSFYYCPYNSKYESHLSETK